MAGAGSTVETDPFKRQQAGPPAGMSQLTAQVPQEPARALVWEFQCSRHLFLKHGL